ncbi:MAG: flagellar filament capping protein FliD [Verrucomicrobia bacterium]|nr:flagellar filament capping protein FliD [Verrucomicrobiota bacterium]
MAGLQLSGLASGFDWKTFVDSLIDLERAPATRLQTEINTNTKKITALGGVESRITELRDASDALNEDGVFDARSATVSGTGWSAAVTASATMGTYAFNVTQRATAAKLVGASDRGAAIASSNDVSGVTLAAMGTGTAVTAGDFTVNGARVTVALTDSLADVFTKISAATGGTVTGAYNDTTDKIELTGSSTVVLGSTTDTSNFLTAARLANNGTSAVASSAALGAITPTATLASSRLRTTLTGLDGSGNGSFTLNGATISYNANTDTLNSVISRINASAAGVSASFDVAGDRVTLTNTSTGDLGFGMTETSGNLLAALGLTTASGSSLTRGLNAQFTVNGGSTLTSMSNTLTEDSHGIAGLSVTPAAIGGTETVTVGSNTSGMRTKIDTFITKFNALQTYIDDQTKVTSSNNKVSASTLSDNREVQSWASQLRRSIFTTVPGLSSSLSRLDHLGIDFTGTTATLTVKDSDKLNAALADRPSEVSALFRQSSTGIAATLDTLFDSYVGSFGGGGLLAGQTTKLTKNNTSLTNQITEIDRRLVQRRSQLEAGFIAMEKAQSLIQQMQTQLTNSFGSSSSKK